MDVRPSRDENGIDDLGKSAEESLHEFPTPRESGGWRLICADQQRPLLALFLFTVIVPELLTGSTPLLSFLNPVLVIFLILGYGIPVLVLRELAVRCNVGLRGLVLFGIAYGIFNEGVLAKTILLERSIPIPQFDSYGHWLGISWPWMIFIGLWHGLASVVFPVVLVHYFYPASSRRLWLPGRVTLLLAGIALWLGCQVFFADLRDDGVVGTLPQLGLLVVLMTALIGVGIAAKGPLPHRLERPSWLAALLGVSVVVPFVMLSVLAGEKVNLFVFVLVFALVLAAYWRILNRNQWFRVPSFLLFGLGWYTQTAIVSILVILGNPLLALATAIVDAGILLLLWRAVMKRYDFIMDGSSIKPGTSPAQPPGSSNPSV